MAVDALGRATPQSDDDQPALGVRQSDRRVRQILGRDAAALPVEPLVLRKAQQCRAPLCGWEGEGLLGRNSTHEATLNNLE
ncbi:MAG: hypothetical protein ACOC9I_02970 [Actinomycetota bacterium]